MIRLLVATLLLAAIAVTVRLKARGTGTTRAIKVSARAAVNRGAVVAIVEAEGRRLLIGASANQVNVLADLGAASPGDELDDDLRGLIAAGSSTTVAARPTPALASAVVPRTIMPRRPGSGRRVADDTFVQRVRRLTVRTADPMRRPRLTDALREETRRNP